VIKIDWAGLDFSEDTVIELVEELGDFNPLIFRQGKWQKAGMQNWLTSHTMDFGGEFGRQACTPMFLEELRAMPAAMPGMLPALQETGFYGGHAVGGFNGFVDYVVLPLALVGLKVCPQGLTRPIGRLMRWGLATFSRPPYQTLLKLKARGLKNDQVTKLEITLSHPNGYWFTAIPVVACLRPCRRQYLDGSNRKPGLWMQANLVDPDRLIGDIRRMGVTMDITEGPCALADRPGGLPGALMG
jgi:saccharopine dehydrogenase (NAD+, L-lysine-forming)